MVHPVFIITSVTVLCDCDVVIAFVTNSVLIIIAFQLFVIQFSHSFEYSTACLDTFEIYLLLGCVCTIYLILK